MSCLELDAEDIRHILELVLLEFPVTEVRVRLPEWTTALEPAHRIHASVIGQLRQAADRVRKIGDIRTAFSDFDTNEYVRRVSVDEVDLGRGCALVTLHMAEDLYYRVISELTGFDIAGEKELIDLLRTLAGMKAEYDKVAAALHDCEDSGYGIVMPDVADMKLDEPEIVRQAGGYGVRLRASASSVHMIRANIQAEVSPSSEPNSSPRIWCAICSASLRKILPASGIPICSGNHFMSWSTRASTPNWSICRRQAGKSFPKRWSASSTRAVADLSAFCFETAKGQAPCRSPALLPVTDFP